MKYFLFKKIFFKWILTKIQRHTKLREENLERPPWRPRTLRWLTIQF